MLEDPSVEDIARMGGLEATGLAGLRDPLAALDCACVCHTRLFALPVADVHDEGRSCHCQLADDERVGPLWDLHCGFHGGDDQHAPAAQAERHAAFVRAWRHGMEITIHSDLAPTIISGCYRGHQFWFHERDGHGQLHLGDLDGPVIAEGAVDGPVDAVDFIRDLIDRYDRVASERGYPAATSTLCSDCGRIGHR
jgi:hypothetical protein